MLGNLSKLLGDTLWRKHQVNTARSHRTAGHGFVFRGFVLRESNPPFRFDGFSAERPISSCAGKNDADSAFTAIPSQRFEKNVDGTRRAAVPAPRRKLQHSTCDLDVSIGRDDVNMIWLYLQLVRHLSRRHGSAPGKNPG